MADQSQKIDLFAKIYITPLEPIPISIIDFFEDELRDRPSFNLTIQQEVPIVELRVDFRGSGEDMGVNLLLTKSCSHLLLTSLVLPKTSSPSITYLQVGSDVLAAHLEVLTSLPATKQVQTQAG